MLLEKEVHKKNNAHVHSHTGDLPAHFRLVSRANGANRMPTPTFSGRMPIHANNANIQR
jgi:hypothetical protein